ncbi:unnamed protein product [Cyclocybe aegerita]|uniref:DUF6534 domain-containing protein n=1 Tax=Cyclocybe aegerita TaxID=1973307 RepID=A0A8S0WB56_CYCAE|nr:unnamed protein product [Cyclocybe aegerita]
MNGLLFKIFHSIQFSHLATMSNNLSEASGQGLGGLFLGYIVGTVLFGITILQVYQYFTNYLKESRLRKLFVIFIFSLDLSHMVIGSKMLYVMMISYGYLPNPDDNVITLFKAFSTVQAAMVMSVQGFYTYQIWRLSNNLYLNRVFAHFVKTVIAFTIICGIGVGTAFNLFENREQVRSLHNFTPSEKNVIFLGLATTAFIDSILGVTMAVVLYQSRPDSRRLVDIIGFLVLFFVGTGLLTAITPLLLLVLYALNPDSMLYISVEFSITRLYANSILALFNAKKKFHKKLETPADLELPASALLFDGGIGGFPGDSHI